MIDRTGETSVVTKKKVKSTKSYVTGYVPLALKKQVRLLMIERGDTWNDVLIVAFQAYLQADEKGAPRKTLQAK